jgi:DNA invertase Pin-like site-specific DNA recombinase
MIYFIYARKSTDVEDKQVRSIEDQLAVLRALAKTEGLDIAQEFIEKQSAENPGRPVFNGMIGRIQKGEAQGIVCWNLDRLSRNPVDSGQVSWLLQKGIIQHIRTPERSYYSKDSVLLMSVEFGMANQYIRDLSANTSRGLREKAKRGDYPAPAPVGYLNNPRTKTIIVDKRKAPVVRKAFELYAENGSRLEDIACFLYENGIRTKATKAWGGDKPFHKDKVKWILTNPFYYGQFRYAGEMYEGRYTPIIEKRLFDKVQEILKLRGRVQKAKKEPTALCRLMKCGSCGCSITAEVITKHQKNGNVHRYVYYRCSKKRGICGEPYIREEEMTAKLSSLLSGFVLPQAWATELSAMADKDEQEIQSITAASVQDLRTKVADLNERIGRLTDLYVEQDIDRDAYLERKRALMSERKSAEEQIARLGRDAAAWLQPLREWIKDAERLDEIAKTADPTPQKSSLLKIFGSNLLLQNRSLVSTPTPPYASLREARQNFSENDLNNSLVSIYNSVRTYFTQNP